MNSPAVTTTPPQRKVVQIQGAFSYVADGMAATANCDFIQDPLFAASYQKGVDTIRHQRPNLNVQWRVHTACWAAAHGALLEGDFVECGVNTGIYSRAIMHYISFEQHEDRLFWLLDTFSGVPEEQMSEQEKVLRANSNEKYTDDLYDRAIATFKDYPNARIIKGMVPDTLPQVTSERIAYLSIDMNLTLPEIAAAEYFWDKLVPGAIMLLDDYGFPAHFEQKQAFDAFASERGVPVLSLPTGQGIIIKP